MAFSDFSNSSFCAHSAPDSLHVLQMWWICVLQLSNHALHVLCFKCPNIAIIPVG